MFKQLHKPAHGLLIDSALVCAVLLLTAGLWVVLTPAGPMQAAAPQHAAPAANNRIVTENALPGTDEWSDIGWNDPPKLNAYAGATSVNAGNPISIYVNTAGSSITWRLYRLGYYQNHGARLITTYGASPRRRSPPARGQSDRAWCAAPGLHLHPPHQPGLDQRHLSSAYGLEQRLAHSSSTSPCATTATTPIIVFAGSARPTRRTTTTAARASISRATTKAAPPRLPGVVRPALRLRRSGTGAFFTHDVDMVRWLEASGYDVTYISDVDTATNPNILLSHKVFLEVGHPEYWTWDERDNVEAALAAGVNMVFASANETYWNMRLEASPVGPNRIITCYKDAALDPTHTAPYTTGRVRRPDPATARTTAWSASATNPTMTTRTTTTPGCSAPRPIAGISIAPASNPATR